MPWERRVLPAPVIPAQAGIQVSRERRSWVRLCLACIDRPRTCFRSACGRDARAPRGTSVPRGAVRVLPSAGRVSEAHERYAADRAVAAGRGVRRPMPWERRVPPAPVIPAQAGIQVSRVRHPWERSCPARIDRLRTRYGPHAGGTPAFPGARAFPGAPCVYFRAPGGWAKRMNDVRRIGRRQPVAETGDRCPGNGAARPPPSFPRKRESRCLGYGTLGNARVPPASTGCGPALGPHAGGTPAHPGARAFPGAPCVCFWASGG